MTKYHIIPLLAALLVMSLVTQAKTAEYIVGKQITLDEREQIPDKTLEVKMNQLKFNTKEQPELSRQLLGLLDDIADNDFANDVFVMSFSQPADTLFITINNCDIIDSIGTNPKLYYGDIGVKQCHFVVTQNPECEKLLKKLFKTDGKINFVREFEYVAFKNDPYNTTAKVTFCNNQLNVNDLIINAEPPQQDTSICH